MSNIAKNSLCPCGSGRKYKKCCMKAPKVKGKSSIIYDLESFNKKFNRFNPKKSNYSSNELGTRFQNTEDYYKKEYCGYIKCKLAHYNNFSLIVPDQIYLGSKPLLWIQPIAFTPNMLGNIDENEIMCGLHIDISCGNTIKVLFNNLDDHITNFADGANLFKCKIEGPIDLEEYATGTCYFNEDNIPYLKLYHHTTEANKKSIDNSKYFKPSHWNIQGTKKLINVGYAYFTPINEIKTNYDLKQIAMANDESLHLMIDDFEAPTNLQPGWEQIYKDKILKLKVYRESTFNRNFTLSFDIDSTILSSQHLHQHHQKDCLVFYSSCNPFIHRVGIEPNELLKFANNIIVRNNDTVKTFDYIIMGDARTFDGLKAPYDEEDTTQILKIETGIKNSNLADFWFNYSNMDHFSGKDIEYQIFDQ